MRSIKRIGLVLILALCAALAFSAQDAAVLLEKAIYTEETLGNLNDAIAIYQQVVANADAARTTAAQALFRLGMCYRKGGRTADAQAAFSKLRKLYPEQQELLALLPSGAPVFLPAPWVDGEVLQYALVTKGSSSIATQINIMEASERNGQSGWKLRSITAMTGAMTSTALWMNSQYAPLYRYQKGPEQEMRGQVEYFSDHFEISGLSGGKNSRFPLTQTAYDGEQVIALLRCLPLREGFQTTLPIIKTSDGSILDLKVEVTGREQISVPAGTYDCYKIITKTSTEERTYWLSSKSPFYPVKFNGNSSIDLELASMRIAIKNHGITVEETNPGISFSIPPGWVTAASSMMGTTILSIVDPEDEAICYIGIGVPSQGSSGAIVQDVPSTLPKVVDQMITMYQSQYKDFSERAGSRAKIDIYGSSAIRFIADHKGLIGGQDMVTYAWFLATDRQIGQVFFKTSRDNFDRLRPAFDSIAVSIRMK